MLDDVAQSQRIRDGIKIQKILRIEEEMIINELKVNKFIQHMKDRQESSRDDKSNTFSVFNIK